MPVCLASIKRSVQSLKKEEREQIEIIICDNHSDDGTFEAAKSFECDAAIRVIQPEEHFENRTLNWHHGLTNAHGKWMMMIHCDDRMAENGISNILQALRSMPHSQIVMISGRHRIFRDQQQHAKLYPRWTLPALIPGEQIRRQILCRYCPFVPFQVMLRSTYEQIGGLDEKFELVQDWDLWIRLLAYGEVYYTGSHFGDWRVHEISGKYAQIFAREHLQLVSGMQYLIPVLKRRQLKLALREQIPRVKKWLPEVLIEDLIADLPNSEIILECWKSDNSMPDRQLLRIRTAIALRLSLIRLLGSINLIHRKYTRNGIHRH